MGADLVRSARARAVVFGYLLVAWISWGEQRVLDRLLFQRAIDRDFVRINLQGVLEGFPVSQSWQHRLLGPWCVGLLDRIIGDREQSQLLFNAALLLAANWLLLCLLQRRNVSVSSSLVAVTTFALAHLLLAFRLEYPWDAVDVLLFVTFGHWVAQGGSLLKFAPALALGAINHETALYFPLWYALDGVVRRKERPIVRPLLGAALAFAIMIAVVALLRASLYVGRPELPESSFELATPVIGNPLHLGHNLRQLAWSNWGSGRAFLSIGIIAAIVTFIRSILRGVRSVAAAWSLCVLGSIFAFGYVNETRLYLPLVAFWLAYAWPKTNIECMSKAFTKEDDDAGVELTQTPSFVVPSGRFRITARGAELLAASPDKSELLQRAEILPPPPAEPQRAVLGVTVRARGPSGDERSYRLVTSEEQGLIGEGCSVQSPLGRALLGAEVGDVREVRTPKGSEELEIVALEG